MKYQHLRRHIQFRKLFERHSLRNCSLIIDAQSVFRFMYPDSQCQFIFGGEYDRFAEYFRRYLTRFLDCNITCYVIFNGAASEDIPNRLIRHQAKINKANNIAEEKAYWNVMIFYNRVIRQLLDELGIKYYCAEYNVRETIVASAKYYDCPVLTNNVEIALFGVSCIPTWSIDFDKEARNMLCQICSRSRCALCFFKLSNNLIPIFLTLADQDLPTYENIQSHINLPDEKLFIHYLYKWTIRKTTDEIFNILKKDLVKDDYEIVVKAFNYNKESFDAGDSMVIEYFEDVEEFKMIQDNAEWFKRGVACGNIAPEYINLIYKGIFCGSWLPSDSSQKDAMMASMDIVKFAYAILARSKKLKIIFVGRKEDRAESWIIEDELDFGIPCDAVFKVAEEDFFKNFVKDSTRLDLNILKNTVPAATWVLIITLVYYSKNTENNIFMKIAYAVLLSYVMVGPVTDKIGIICQNNRNLNVDDNNSDDSPDVGPVKYRDCVDAAKAFMPFFDVGKIEDTFKISILHAMAEFQHCLYHMNCLNSLCGERVSETKYHKTFNGTFVFNVFCFIEGSSEPVKQLLGLLQNDSTVGTFYRNLVNCFERCLESSERTLQQRF